MPRRLIPRPLASGRAAVLALLALGPSGACLGPPAPEKEDWLAVGYRRPEQTFRTFQTGLAGDEPDLEYRSLSLDFLRRNGIKGQLFYREGRAELLDDQPFIRYLATADVLESRRLPDGRHELLARVKKLTVERFLRIAFVRESFWELYGEDGELLQSDTFALAEHLQAKDGYLVGFVPHDALPDEVSEVRLGTDWKIDDIEILDHDPRSEPQP